MFRGIRSIIVVASVVVFISACATMDKISEQTKNIKIPTLGSNSSARAFAANYKQTEVPHTLMRKPVAKGVLTSKFGVRFSPTGIPFPKKHKGIDYAGPTGTAIFASGDGVIDRKYVSTSYGNVIKIRHANGFASLYAHLDAFAAGVEEGTKVTRGQIIGTMGNTGNSTGTHLHYELHHNGKQINPLF